MILQQVARKQVRGKPRYVAKKMTTKATTNAPAHRPIRPAPCRAHAQKTRACKKARTDDDCVLAPRGGHEEHHRLVRVGQRDGRLQPGVHGPEQQEPHPAVPQRVPDERGGPQQPVVFFPGRRRTSASEHSKSTARYGTKRNGDSFKYMVEKSGKQSQTMGRAKSTKSMRSTAHHTHPAHKRKSRAGAHVGGRPRRERARESSPGKLHLHRLGQVSLG